MGKHKQPGFPCRGGFIVPMSDKSEPNQIQVLKFLIPREFVRSADVFGLEIL